jgi:hypothetical protein
MRPLTWYSCLGTLQQSHQLPFCPHHVQTQRDVLVVILLFNAPIVLERSMQFDSSALDLYEYVERFHIVTVAAAFFVTAASLLQRMPGFMFAVCCALLCWRDSGQWVVRVC